MTRSGELLPTLQRGLVSKRALRIILSCVALVASTAAGSAAMVAEERGGSNYGWYGLEGCKRVGNVVRDYDTHKALIDQQLSEMYANGQRRLAVEILFSHGGVGGVLDSTGGDVDPHYKENLKAYLATVKKIGFQGVLVKFIAIGPSSLWAGHHPWTEWHEDIYQEHWNLIRNLRPIFVASRVPYQIDLLSEAVPVRNHPINLHYVQRLWAEYTRAFGKHDTVGFAIITAIKQDRFAQLPAMYGNNRPEMLDLHIYRDAYRIFLNAHERLQRLGYGNIPWEIGEALYNDGQEADELARAIAATGQRVRYILQWPVTRANQCHAAVDIPAPLQFDQYMRRGF